VERRVYVDEDVSNRAGELLPDLGHDSLRTEEAGN
jgi:hypothetical protein